MFQIYKHKRKKVCLGGKRGFTLAETLVAITVVSVAIVGPLVIAKAGLDTAYQAQNQLTAVALAQDAMEYMRYARDNGKLESGLGYLSYFSDIDLANGDFGAGQAFCIDTASGATPAIEGCIVDTAVEPANAFNLVVDSTDSNNGPIQYNENSGFYGYGTAANGWEDTIFTRRVWVREINVGVEARVTVQVTWRDGPREDLRTITFVENIFNI